MTSHRAAYLRRAIPRLREQIRPSSILATWVDEVSEMSLHAWQRRLIDAREGQPEWKP